jgi:excisionase family DNA binding protein
LGGTFVATGNLTHTAQIVISIIAFNSIKCYDHSILTGYPQLINSFSRLEGVMEAAKIPEPIAESVLTAEEAQQAKVAQRCIMAALDHSHAHRIAVLDESGQSVDDMPAIAVPPRVLRLFADLLGRMSQGQPVALVPYKYELSTQEAAAILNVSRPFVIKELEAGRIPFRKVGTHRRILFEDLTVYQEQSRQTSEQALRELAQEAQDLNMGY